MGYKIYRDYKDRLDKIDIYIRDEEDDKLMKITTEGESESMIGVRHPKNGLIGYLRYEIYKE